MCRGLTQCSPGRGSSPPHPIGHAAQRGLDRDPAFPTQRLDDVGGNLHQVPSAPSRGPHDRGLESLRRRHRQLLRLMGMVITLDRTRPRRQAMGTKFVYDFNEGNRDMKDLLGGKGANLAEMTNMGLPVPPGFTISTEACLAYLKENAFPSGLMGETEEHLQRLEAAMGKKLGEPSNPLLEIGRAH